ncbi:ParM/StbA family protein [Cytobacillus oceanisediminis]|uniref:ParM/StbA family protein n=1 Tax=Cytobacillus oceanisediminis TaxID=665099 RepID=UPI001FB44D82|nr:ParM/StbA family protein [Cytobacillus oceanisediminis]UOE58123.1 ParM/StbA family protein [Cytobacillus oceanisediminis]
MSLIFGIDVGYSHTKLVGPDGYDIFRSTVKQGVIDVNANSTVIEYEGKKLTIGERGRITVAANKIADPNFEPLLLTAVLRNMDEKLTNVKVKLVTGLPIGWYKKQKDELRDFLLNKKVTVGYKGKDRTIHIEDCLVFPQSAGLALTNPKEFEEGRTNLIIDIGGLTVDVSYYEGRTVAHLESYQLGMLKFYAKVASAINQQFNVQVSDQDVERFIEEGAVIIDEEQVDFDFDTHFKEWMDQIVTQIKLDFPYDIVHKKTWVGGGALRFNDYLPTKKSIDCDKILNNAEAFYNVGVQKFG